MENFTPTEMEYALAKERVDQLKKFYISLAAFFIVFAVYAIRKYYKTGEIDFLNFNNISVIFWIWALVLLVKAVKIFFFNQDWERKMLHRELNK